MSDRDLLLSIQAQINDYLGAVTPPPQESCERMVIRLYDEELHRYPDSGGLDFWTARCEAGMAEAQIRAILRTAEPPPPPIPPSTGNPSAIQPSLAWGEVRQQHAQSAEVMAFPIDAFASVPGALAFTQGQQPATAAHVVTEYTVSPTPGIIDPASSRYYRSVNVNSNAVTVERALAGWYINVRWTYPANPAWGYCGFSLQWAPG